MSKKVLIELEGGFHNSPATRAYVPAFTLSQGLGTDALNHVSPRVQSRLRRHFCGLESCQCGGPFRAELRLVSHRFTPV